MALGTFCAPLDGVQIAVGWEAIGDIGKLTFLPRGVTSHIDRDGSSSSFLATILIAVVNLRAD
jgi:hypothetical protein